VSTKTYINTLGVGAALARVFLQHELDDGLERTADAIANYLADWRQRTERLKGAFGLPQRLYFLGRGASLAAAQYGALITKEAARWPVEALSAPQFRHGPLELADPDLTVVIVAGQKGVARQYNQTLFADLSGFGTRAFWLDTDSDGGLLTIPTTIADTRWIAEAIPLQLLSIAIAEQLGIRPGLFRHLSKVTSVL
jgi:glucosamine--fructose-6-phosphate aminotransferase (isomerizing)